MSVESSEFPGVEVEGYKIVSLLGKGSIGAVYKAVDSKGEDCAIKIMRITPFINPVILESVVQGALATRKMPEHIKIVRVISAGKTAGFYFIVMNFINGSTLEKAIYNESVPFEKKMRIALSLAESLSSIHNSGFIHGDLKPGNVLLDKNREPYINDFYYASVNTMREQTLRVFPQGTPRYMSPEQAVGKFITPASDIYSFGVLLYELFTGKTPYKTSPSEINNMVEIVLNGEIIPPMKADKKIGLKMNAIIMKLLEKKIKNRYSNMTLVASDIKASIEGSSISISYDNGSFFSKIKNFLKI